jgi:hypothetical protein
MVIFHSYVKLPEGTFHYGTFWLKLFGLKAAKRTVTMHRTCSCATGPAMFRPLDRETFFKSKHWQWKMTRS